MKRIDGPGATASNLFTNGDPGLGIEATAIIADWLNNVQEEICQAIEGLGGTLNGADQNQLYDMLIAKFSQVTHNHNTAYSALGHNHDTAYSAINHNHTGIYEPAFAKGTAFNKNFGTTAGTVAQGNHIHSPRGALVFFTGTFALSHGTVVQIPFNNEVYDTDNIHDNVTNNTRLTVPAGVTKVIVSGQTGYNEILNKPDGTMLLEASYNGVSQAINGNVYQLFRNDTYFGFTRGGFVSPVLQVTGGDYFELSVNQRNALSATYNAASGGAHTWFSMLIVG